MKKPIQIVTSYIIYSTLLQLITTIIIIIIPTTLSLSTSTSTSTSISIYEVMRSNDLPAGLFPTGITNFTIDPITGRFQATLNHSCDATFETDVHYHRLISGTIRHAEIVQITGVSAQDLFLWFPVRSIRVDFPTTGIVHFDVGVVRKQFSLSMFESPPECTASEVDPPLTTSRPQKQVGTIEREQERQVTILRSSS